MRYVIRIHLGPDKGRFWRPYEKRIGSETNTYHGSTLDPQDAAWFADPRDADETLRYLLRARHITAGIIAELTDEGYWPVE